MLQKKGYHLVGRPGYRRGYSKILVYHTHGVQTSMLGMIRMNVIHKNFRMACKSPVWPVLVLRRRLTIDLGKRKEVLQQGHGSVKPYEAPDWLHKTILGSQFFFRPEPVEAASHRTHSSVLVSMDETNKPLHRE